jgi:hypothetical protein
MLDKIKDLGEVATAYVGTFAVYFNIENIMNCFNVTNHFFEATQFIWKTLALVPAVIYTILKIRYDKSDKNSNNKP